jgi:hypothetical protein
MPHRIAERELGKSSSQRASRRRKQAQAPHTEDAQVSIRPSVIDRTGQRPCLPANALLAVCERLAEGGTPSLRERVTAALQQLRTRLGK